MALKYINIFTAKALQNLPQLGFFGFKINHLATLTLTFVKFPMQMTAKTEIASRSKEDPQLELSKNKYSMPNTQDSGPSSLGGYPMQQPQSMDGGYDYRRLQVGGPSRSVGLPSRGSRGPSAESERMRAREAVKLTKPNGPLPRDHAEVGGPATSVGHSPAGLPVPNNKSEASLMLVQSNKLKGKRDSKEKVDKHSVNLLDEFLNNGNVQVSTLRNLFPTHFFFIYSNVFNTKPINKAVHI
jgi:hypothetical protein